MYQVTWFDDEGDQVVVMDKLSKVVELVKYGFDLMVIDLGTGEWRLADDGWWTTKWTSKDLWLAKRLVP